MTAQTTSAARHIQIQAIDLTNKQMRDKFIRFAWKIYADDPQWVPPLLMDMHRRLDPKKDPFFTQGDMQAYFAIRGKEIVGRIAAIDNHLYNTTHNTNIGWFGYFECINDQTVANKLFDAATDWLRLRKRTQVLGPASPSSNHEFGLQITGFDEPPRLMMAHNPPYYRDLAENYGFTKERGLVAYKISQKKVLSNPKLKRVTEIAKKRSDIKIRQGNLRKLKDEIKIVQHIYNTAWAGNWGFVPLMDSEIEGMAKDLKQLVDESLLIFLEKDGQPIAFGLVLRDYNHVFKKMNGSLFPFNFLKLFTQRKKIIWSRIITLGILPEYRGRGIDAVLYYEIVKRSRKLGIEYGEASWILEDNLPMVRAAEEVMSGEPYKRYIVYGLDL